MRQVRQGRTQREALCKDTYLIKMKIIEEIVVIKELLRQREALSDEIEGLKGTLYSATRDALLGNIRSLDEVLKCFSNTYNPPVESGAPDLVKHTRQKSPRGS